MDEENDLRLTPALEAELERLRDEAIELAIGCVVKAAGKRRAISLPSA